MKEKAMDESNSWLSMNVEEYRQRLRRILDKPKSRRKRRVLAKSRRYKLERTGICQRCGKEIERSSEGEWTHSAFQGGRPISLSKAEQLAGHNARPK